MIAHIEAIRASTHAQHVLCNNEAIYIYIYIYIYIWAITKVPLIVTYLYK
jgi:hypothetical protein